MKLLLTLLLVLVLPGSVLADPPPGVDYERNLIETIREIQSLDLDRAFARTRDLIDRYPKSRLGHLLYADLLLARAAPLTEIGSGIGTERAMRDFRHEIRQRWRHDNSPAHRGYYPDDILFVAENQPYVILVDQQNSRVYVYRNEQGDLQLETDYYISIGLKGYGKQKRGDQKTPVGIYHVTHFIDGEKLPDLYGEGAFPINYPNAWDKRKQRTGDGIWIHGTPSYTHNRSPWASDGCIVVSNPDFQHIDKYIRPELNTPVVVTRQVNWISRDRWLHKRQEVMQVLSTWLTDWQSLDHNNYRRHYSRTELDAYGRDFKSWDGHKRWVNRNKTWINVEYSKLNIFNYPSEDKLMLMQFEQSYRSNNLNIDSPKELFWRKTDTHWRIVHEGTWTLPPPPNNLVRNQ